MSLSHFRLSPKLKLNQGVPRFAGHSPEPGQTAVHFTWEGFTWAGSNPVPLWCPEEAG
ncbi:unnamed protein product [Brassica oleracea]|uniref:(rape) hypothetical protein n=1 Tax=Brassica napus TaxID=3708 RepID=A0A816I2Q1_BRANA|nr:unnamed protein product [Brassica napus]